MLAQLSNATERLNVRWSFKAAANKYSVFVCCCLGTACRRAQLAEVLHRAQLAEVLQAVPYIYALLQLLKQLAWS
jgi:hypothetical protein